jgi:hypothetical protein
MALPRPSSPAFVRLEMNELFKRLSANEACSSSKVVALACDLLGFGRADDDSDDGYQGERYRRYAQRVFDRGVSAAIDLRMLRVDPELAAPLRESMLRLRAQYVAADFDAIYPRPAMWR